MIIFRRISKFNLTLAGLFGTVLGAISTLIVVTLVTSNVPVQVIETRPDVANIAHDSVLETHYKFLRRQGCNSVVSTWMWRWVGGDGATERQPYYVSIGTAFVTLADPSPLIQNFIIARPLPAAVTPGQWFLRSKYLDYCRVLAPIFGPTVRVSMDELVTVPESAAR